MLEDHKNDPHPTALVICNSFDAERIDIEDFLDEKRILSEMFEIDRVRSEERQDYLNCFNEVLEI
jgi:hypothetical protein